MCIVQVGNFRVEPPGLFRGRGEHPKMGKLKKRVYPYDITINIGKGEPIPEHPFPGMKWKEIRHDNTVTWLAYWKVCMFAVLQSIENALPALWCCLLNRPVLLE